jgi:NADH:ubiquinone oxidoreductase subunit F (NADH-binding)
MGRGLLEELAQAMADASICGLGQAAPNPIRCVMKYFPEVEVQRLSGMRFPADRWTTHVMI